MTFWTTMSQYGYFSLSELTSVKLVAGLGIERDLYFEPCPMEKAIERYK